VFYDFEIQKEEKCQKLAHETFEFHQYLSQSLTNSNAKPVGNANNPARKDSD
jgi:hypothetical protein